MPITAKEIMQGIHEYAKKHHGGFGNYVNHLWKEVQTNGYHGPRRISPDMIRKVNQQMIENGIERRERMKKELAITNLQQQQKVVETTNNGINRQSKRFYEEIHKPSQKECKAMLNLAKMQWSVGCNIKNIYSAKRPINAFDKFCFFVKEALQRPIC